MQNINKISSYIGFAIKSGQILFGIDAISVYRKKIHLIVLSNTLSEKSRQNAYNIASKKGIDVVELEESIENITKRKNCKVLAITNFELANAIKNS